MDKIKPLFQATNGLGRTVRTSLQAFVGILVFVYGVITIPEVQDFLVQNNLVAIGTLATTIGAMAGIQNAAEKLLRYLFGDE